MRRSLSHAVLLAAGVCLHAGAAEAKTCRQLRVHPVPLKAWRGAPLHGASTITCADEAREVAAGIFWWSLSPAGGRTLSVTGRLFNRGPYGLHRMMREGDNLSAAYLQIDSRQAEKLYARLKAIPAVAGVALKTAALASFKRTMDESMGIMIGFSVFFASIL